MDRAIRFAGRLLGPLAPRWIEDRQPIAGLSESLRTDAVGRGESANGRLPDLLEKFPPGDHHRLWTAFL